MKTKTKILYLLIGGMLLATLTLLVVLQGGTSPHQEEVSVRQVVQPKLLSGNEKKKNVSTQGASKTTGFDTKKTPFKRVNAEEPGRLTDPESVRRAVDPVTALKSWEDRMSLYTEEGAKERVKATPVTVKEQEELRDLFSDLSPEAQIENIHHAMNLLPDETVEVVFGILFDTSQSPEVLNAIFHDVLNRDEAIKNPMMETIAKDKSHPMYVESARILDIVK